MYQHGLAGVHIRQGERHGYRPFLENANDPLAIFALDEGGALQEAEEINPNGIRIFRTRVDGRDAPHPSDGPVKEVSAWWMDRILKVYAMNPWATHLADTNELTPGSLGELEWFAEFTLHNIERAQREGVALVIQNWATGNPSDDPLTDGRPFMAEDRYATQVFAWARAAELGFPLGLHEYGLDKLLKESAPDHALRHRRVIRWCQEVGISLPIVITEAGNFGGFSYPGDGPFIDDVSWYLGEVRRNPEVRGVCWFTLGNYQDANIQDGLPEYAAWIQANPAPLLLDPPPPPPPPPPADTIDLADFVIGQPGVQHVLQCDFGDHFQGTQTLCTLDLGDGIYAQQKDDDQEIIYIDDYNIYRDTDTSPDDRDGRKTFYCQYEEKKRGAYWCDRFVRVGQNYHRNPTVRHMYFEDCEVFIHGTAPSRIRIAGFYDAYQYEVDGHLFDAPVVELVWEVDGRVVERYLYGYKRGLICWTHEARGWESYIVEEHTGRPAMNPPAWPGCHPRPMPELLYYQVLPPGPDPEPDPREYDRIFHLVSESIEPGSPEALTVWLVASQMRSTCGYSWHDACVDAPGLLSRTVHTWDLLEHERAALEAFQRELFPGDVAFHHRETDDPHLSWEALVP